MDFRTIEALQFLGYIDKDIKVSAIRDTPKGYYSYRSIIMEITKKTKRKLREIDKALFKFHKIESFNMQILPT